jgi:excisionase family DNA binding protein
LIVCSPMSRKLYTTQEAAKAANISRPTIQYWILTGKIKPPKPVLDGARAKRLWTEAEVSKLRKLGETLKPGPESKKKK